MIKSIRSCVLTVMLCLVIACLELSIPLVVGSMMLHAAIQGHLIEVPKSALGHMSIQNGLCLLWLINLALGLLHFFKTKRLTDLEIAITHRVQRQLFQTLFKLPLEFFDGYPLGALSHKLLVAKTMTQPFHPGYVGTLLSLMCACISLSVMLSYAWKLTFCVIGMLIVYFIMTSWILIKTLRYQALHTQHTGEVYRFIFQVLHGFMRIKLFAQASHLEKVWRDMNDAARMNEKKAHRLGVWRFTILSSMQMTLVLMMFLLVHRVYDDISLDHFMLYSMALTQFLSKVLPFYASFHELLPAVIAYQHIQPIFLCEQERIGPDRPIVLSGKIRVRDLCFQYEHASVSVFKNLNFSVASGEHVAIVGASGSGKSTLIKLLLGLYRPQRGDIEFDDVSIAHLNVKTLRQQMGVVFQDSSLLNGSIFENMVGHTDASEKEVEEALAYVGLSKWIHRLPMGVHTQVAQHMNLMSGGQKQLLLIAKALMHRPNMLILDEATSFLDDDMQRFLHLRMQQLKMTRITIAHRLSTLMYADKIFVMHAGQIMEQGSYQALLDRQGLFYTFVQAHMTEVASL